MNELPILNNAERLVIGKLAEVWNAFIELPQGHPDEVCDFRKAVHDAQRIIMSRPAYRDLKSREGYAR